MTPRERAYQLRDALRARDIALDVTAVDAVEAAILADRAERDAVRESACAAYERALAEQAAGEAERTAQAVAREREACAVLCETWTNVYPGASYARADAARIRARATSPEPEPCVAPGHPRCSASAPCSWCHDAGASPAPAPLAAAERAVIEAAEAWRASPDGPGECWHEARMREAVDALAAARKDGVK